MCLLMNLINYSQAYKNANLTLPTNYQEVKFLAEDLGAIQEETGLRINADVVQQLLLAAIARFK